MTLDEYKSLQVGDIIKYYSPEGFYFIAITSVDEEGFEAKKLVCSDLTLSSVISTFRRIERNPDAYAPDKLLIKAKNEH